MSDTENLTPPAEPAPAARKRKHETRGRTVSREAFLCRARQHERALDKGRDGTLGAKDRTPS